MLINKQYKLNKELPKEIKLEVYRKALEHYKGSLNNKSNAIGDGLCLVLPCLLWNLDSFFQDDPNSCPWNYENTEIAFPEMKVYIDYLKEKLSSLSRKEMINIRIRALQNAINTLQ